MLQSYITQSATAEGSERLQTMAVDLINGAECRPLKSNRGFATPIVASILLHVGVAGALLAGAMPDNSGGGTVELDQISVTIVSTSDLGLAPLTSVQQPDENTALPTQLLPAESKPDTDGTIAKPDTKSPESIEPALHAPLIDQVLEAKSPILKKHEEPKDVPNEQYPSKPDTPDQKPAQNQPSVASKAPVAIGGTSGGEAIASRGDVNRYAREIALVIGRNSPRGVGLKGKLLVEFTLSPQDGTLQSTNVVKSSGTAKLDQLAKSAIANGKYPPPPPGMTAKDLTFRVPFAFE